MRLVCPNCGAQYEVPADAIPASGRDVQCSACGHTWFEGRVSDPEPHPEPDAEVAAAAEQEADLAWSDPEGVPHVDDDEEERDDLAELAWEPGPDPESGSPAPGFDDDARTDDDVPASSSDDGPAAPRPVRSTVTPEIAEILREEAEREARARAEEAARLVQAPEAEGPYEAHWDEPAPAPVRRAPDPEPGWDSVPTFRSEPAARPMPAADAAPPDRDRQRAEEARRRMARLRGEPPPMSAAPTRRDRLPDIEEIDSSLRGKRQAAVTAPSAPSSARGFRLGFGAVLLAAALLALLYAYAPRITAAVPALGAVVDPYARTVDRGRLWLDARMRGMVEGLGGTNAALPSSSAPASEAPEVQVDPPAAPAPAATGG